MSTEPKLHHTAVPAPRYAAGDEIAGRYRLEEVIGEGGMGTVWLARNVALDATVALKLIRQGFESEEAADRLLEEARAAAKIEHSAIVRVFDFGETELGDPYIVMELLEGKSLGETLEERGRLDPASAICALLPVIDGLRCAHEAGVVHRDLKPSNIFLSWEGNRVQPKVVDFGVAKIDRRDAFRKLTQQGTVLGSPAYMAPEQARGQEDVDHRADVWTISVVLYEAITGTAAFRGANYNAVMRSVIEDDVVPITELDVSDLNDSRLWEILARGLSKDREERFQSMEALGTALAEWLFYQGVTEDLCGTSIEEVWLSGGLTDAASDEAVSGAEEPMVVLLSRPRHSRAPASFEPAAESASTAPLVRERFSIPPSRAFLGRPGRWPIAVAAAIGITVFVAAFTIVRAVRGDASWVDAASAAAAGEYIGERGAPSRQTPATPTKLLTVPAPTSSTSSLLGVPPLGSLSGSLSGSRRTDRPLPSPPPRTAQVPKPRASAPKVIQSKVAAPTTVWPLPASGLPAALSPAETGADLKDPYR